MHPKQFNINELKLQFEKEEIEQEKKDKLFNDMASKRQKEKKYVIVFYTFYFLFKICRLFYLLIQGKTTKVTNNCEQINAGFN